LLLHIDLSALKWLLLEEIFPGIMRENTKDAYKIHEKIKKINSDIKIIDICIDFYALLRYGRFMLLTGFRSGDVRTVQICWR